MNIMVQTADLERDRDVLIATLREFLTRTSNEHRFDWLYRQNPYGAARVWLARDSEKGEIVGASAAFPRRAIVKGKEQKGWVLGDFCIASQYRSLGPALHLQRATLSAIAQLPGSDFCYDFPSYQLTAIYRRLGTQPANQMVRLAKPLRIDQKLDRFGNLATPAKWIGNCLLRLTDWRTSKGRSWDIQPHEGECGDEFTELTNKLRSRAGAEIQRSADYLNWRYLRHPFFRHQILTARHAGELQGYIVFTCVDGHAQIVEWCTGDNPALLSALVHELVRRLRNTGAFMLSAYLLNSDERLPALKKMGFWPRESSPVVVNWPAADVLPAARWRLTQGDRDS